MRSLFCFWRRVEFPNIFVILGVIMLLLTLFLLGAAIAGRFGVLLRG